MKLKYIVNARIPTEKAHGYQICKMCEEFAKQGVEVELVVPIRKNHIKEDVFEYYGLKKNFKILYLPVINALNFKILPEKYRHILFRFFFLLKLSFSKHDKECVIYTRDPEIAWLFSSKGCKTIYEAHNWSGSKVRLHKIFLSKCDIVTISRGLRDIFIQNRFASRRTSVAPDGVDLSLFDIGTSQEQAREKLGLPLGKKIVLYSGHLYEWKGAQVLADAAREMSIDTVIYFVGGLKNEVLKFEEKNRILIEGNKIKVAGHQPHSDIPFWLKAADVLVLPNSKKQKISSLYTSPLKLFEYMASQRPIIASDLPSLREVLNESNSLMVEPDNSLELAKGVKRLLNDKSLMDKISRNAYNDSKKYSWENRANTIINKIKNK